MKRKIFLTTSGYEFIMYLLLLNDAKDRLGIISCIVPDKNLKFNSIRSQSKTIFLEDLKKLASYLNSHLLNKLKDDSHIFMGYDCSYQIQALKGVIAPNIKESLENDDAFNIRCLVNIGSTGKTPFSEYFGGESVVTVGNCHKFIESLEESYTEFKAMLN